MDPVSVQAATRFHASATLVLSIVISENYERKCCVFAPNNNDAIVVKFSFLFNTHTHTQDIESIENNWRSGQHMLKRINCRSENSKGVYCLQYDDHKIVSGLRDNTIKIWDRSDLKCVKTLTGHTGSVLCLQYDDKVIISGSSDSTVRVWDVISGEMVNTLIHHCEAVLHLRFNNGMMVTCSKVQLSNNIGE